MKRTFTYGLLLIACFLLSACSRLPINTVSETKQIAVGPGPEDMVLDNTAGTERLLVSCNERRLDTVFGEIFEINLNNNSTRIIPRLHSPEDIVFNPHGIDIKTIDGVTRLYAISHNDAKKRHTIVVYRVYADSLVYETLYENQAAMNTPNDLAVTEKGDIYVSNDAGKRGSVWEQLWKLKRSNIVFYDSELKLWKKVADGLVYANGVAVDDTCVYVATTRTNKLFSYKREADGNLSNRRTLAEVPGQDNIMFHGDELIFTSHPKVFKFIKHVKSSEKKSPSQVHSYNCKTGEYKLLFADDGYRISASSTALIIGDKLYISQVFDPYILQVQLK
ncbi:MAG: SMP-30/gluconolactonase/LRE family protein [Bacteroidia bacterium]